MRERIHSLTGDNDTGYINTFHGFCVSILQEDSHAVQYPKSFLVLDNADIDDMLKVIYAERGLTLRDRTFSDARNMIEIQKTFKRPEYYHDMITMSLDILKQKYDEAIDPDDIIFYGYLYQEKKCFGLDYNDLIKFSLYIFEEHEDIRLKWQQRLEYIMIDEFQDIDELQYKLMEVLCDYHKNLFIVGDPDQTIYTWRGANTKYLLEFDKAFPNTRTIMMMQNYRSTPQILAVANSLIAKNQYRIPKDLVPMLENGPKVVCHYADDTEAEAKWIATTIQKLHKNQVNYRDITILYRAHYVTRSLEEVFIQKQIPYTIYSGVQFFMRTEIKDAHAYLRMLLYKDDLSFLRIINVPRRNIGERRVLFLKEFAAEHDCSLYQALKLNLDDSLFKSTKAQEFVNLIESFSESCPQRQVSEILSDILDKSHYELILRTEGDQVRLDNLAELKQSIYDYERNSGEECTLEHYLKHIGLFTNSDLSEMQDKVKMMTVHTAKGLEFPYVFLCAMNEGLFPARKTNTQQRMEEERRLAFVAITRAEKALYLSESNGIHYDGSPRYPSRFLLDIDQDLLKFTRPPAEGLIQQSRSYINYSNSTMVSEEPPKNFQIGQRVRHPVMGPGTILGVDTDKSAYQIQFDGIVTPRNISFRVKLVAL